MKLSRKERFGLFIIVFLLFLYIILSSTIIQNNKYYVTSLTSLLRFNSYRTNHCLNDFIESSSINRLNLPRILIVIGTRPEAIKCAPLIAELKSDRYHSRFQVIVISTGQHREILQQTLVVFKQKIDINLDLMSYNQTLTQLFSRIYFQINQQINLIHPNLVIVQGDTTTALASSLAAAYNQLPVAHVEAGLQTFNLSNPYPEELNRKIIDSFSTLLFAPTTFAKQVLLEEGICHKNIFITGNTGVDAFYHYYKQTNITTTATTKENISIVKIIENFKKKQYNSTYSHNNRHHRHIIILVTMHRRENFPYLFDMSRAIATIAKQYECNLLFILPIHPNPNVKQIIRKNLNELINVKIIDLISYDIFGYVLFQSDIIMTDSGGIQEEAVSIGKTVILMRMTTERPEGIYLGTIKQIGIIYDDIIQALNYEINHLIKLQNSTFISNQNKYIFGDGTASKQIATIIDDYFYNNNNNNQSNHIDLKCTTKYRQDKIAQLIYSYSNISSYKMTIPSHHIRRYQIYNLTKVKSSLTLQQIFQLYSQYNISKRNDDKYSVTVIIGIYKHQGLIQRWIEALLLQTHPPKQIWITYFASPIRDKIQVEIEQIYLLFTNQSTYSNDLCMKKKCHLDNINKDISNCYEECIILCIKLPSILFINMRDMQLKYYGRFQLALQSHTKYVVVFDDDCIPQSQYFETALYTINTEEYHGILGTKGTAASPTTFYGPISRSNKIIEVECCWWKLILSSNKGDTTGRVAGTASSRKYIKDQLWLRGDRLMHSYQISKPSLLIYAETQNDAMFLIKYTKQSMTQLNGLIHFTTSNLITTNLETNEIKKLVASFHDMMIGRDYNIDPTPIIAASEVLYGFDMIMQGTQSTAVIIIGSSSTVTMFGLVCGAFLRNIPIVNIYIYIENSINDERRAHKLC
ncbi:unnamed protein product [Rotaria sp. Silwood2]|nr:unnamed protein product [Rotaria sp. Silwood2]